MSHPATVCHAHDLYHLGRCPGQWLRLCALAVIPAIMAALHDVHMTCFAGTRNRFCMHMLGPGELFLSTSCLQVRVELFDVRRTRFVLAHTSALAAITLSTDGKLLATASERGTLVRIHSTHDGSKLQVRVLGRHPAAGLTG